jgi:hypothetical protein
MSLFLLKLALTPSLLLFVSWLQRRFGHHWSGIFTGLPLNVGPMAIFLSAEEGLDYVRADIGVMALALVAHMFYFLTYLVCAKRYGWLISITASLVVYSICAYSLLHVVGGASDAVKFALCFFSPIIVLVYLKKQKEWNATPTVGRQTIWLRAAVGVGCLLLATYLAHVAPPALVGVLAVGPVFNTVMLVFSHHDYGRTVLNSLVLGSLIGIYGSMAFLGVLKYAPHTWPQVLIFILAFASAALVATIAHYAMTHLRFGKIVEDEASNAV